MPRRIRPAPVLLAVLAVLLSLWAVTARAQNDSTETDSTTVDDIPPPASKRITAVRITGRGIALDGRLDDEAWRRATFVSDFLQKEPNEGSEPTERTEVAFYYDDDALYVGARMFSHDPDQIRATVTRRDNSGTSERIIVALDTYHDRRTAYSFSVTAAGVRTDYYHPDNEEFDREYSFDPVWEAATNIDSAGWTAEMRIPFSQLRFNALPEQIWGINMDRWIPTKNEDIYWIPVPKDGTGWASRFGELNGIAGIKPSRRIEVLPYVAGGARLSGERDPDDPFNNGHEINGRAGLDFKMGLGPNLTLDGTINPDFGQVEADPADVNLTAFETFFSERRPFFVEGSDLLEGDGPGYFYSRRIGAAPHGYPDGDYIDRPENSTILGAVKVTGRLPSGMSVGALGAVTGREEGRGYDADSRRFDTVGVEPMTLYSVGRVQQEFGEDASTVGLMATGVARAFREGEPLADELVATAVSGGADWDLRMGDGEYNVSGHLGGSYVAGTSAAITRVQQSSAHYFQRPDAGYISVDTARRSLAGYTAALAMARNGGTHWLWDLHLSMDSPGLELNDIGRLGSADNIDINGTLHYRDTRPGEIFHSYDLAFTAGDNWDFGGTNRYRSLDLTWNVTFRNFLNAMIGFNAGDRGISDNMTRGGPQIATSSNWEVEGSISSNFAATTRWHGYAYYRRTSFDGLFYQVDGGIATTIGDRLEIALDPKLTRAVNVRQFIDAIDGGSPATNGTRYIFSRIDETTISAQLRINYAITPNLSLEFYAEPFAASGRYDNFGEVPAPRTDYMRIYGTDGTSITRQGDGTFTVVDGASTFTIQPHDFNIGLFRSNLVLRWEWRPGSTFYLVWQQDRSHQDEQGERVGLRDVGSSITAPGDHLLSLKLSYWLPVD
ncbi:MAG: hypothetical protein JWQ98_2433 [Chlorobi bacterium]|nr:hypothetical protein [Chlorobiota bacterium]